MSNDEAINKISQAMIKLAANQGKVLELGWFACANVFQPKPEYVNEMRLVYYAGAQHLFASMLQFMDPDMEPTAADMKRMDMMYAELKAVEPELELRGIATKGRG